jgi:HD-GYP domain-containing protein (c-di-GMP phosphodiesterase class II)
MPDRMHEEIDVKEKAIEERILVLDKEIPEPEVKPENPVRKNPFTWITGGVKSVKSSFDEWVYLQTEIKGFPLKLEENQKLVEEKLNDYRIQITSLNYKAQNVDSKVWDEYFQIITDRIILEKKIKRYPLRLKTLRQLKDLYGECLRIQNNQQDLINFLPKAAESLEFYDKMQTIRADKHEKEMQRTEDIRIIEDARQSLISTMTNIRKVYDDDAIKYTSQLINLEEAEKNWEQQIDEIIQEEQSDSMQVDEILQKIEALQQLIIDSPHLLLRIRDVESRLARITQVHDLLIANGKSIVPQKDVVKISSKLYDQVPQLWAVGQKAELEKSLDMLEDFLSSFENSVETELVYLEKRKPGVTRSIGILQQENNSLISQLTNLSKSMINALDARDHFMRGHSESVSRWSVSIAKQLGWQQGDIEFLLIAGLLHDIGKISIPESVLSKATPLTPEEWKIIQMHPYFGAQIIKPVEAMSRIVPWVYHHHEKWDGTGYPNHLSKKEIPQGACILSLAEAFSVMVIDTPNRRALSREDAIDIIKENSGTQFSPEVVDAFLSIPNLQNL